MSMRRICALNALYEPWAHLKTSSACLLCGKHVNASQQAARKPVSLLARFFFSTPWCPLIDAMVSEIRPLFVEEVEPQMDWIHSQHELGRAEQEQADVVIELRCGEEAFRRTLQQLVKAEARVANPSVAAKKTTKRGKGAAAAGVSAAAATTADLEEALAKEKIKTAKHLKVC